MDKRTGENLRYKLVIRISRFLTPRLYKKIMIADTIIFRDSIPEISNDAIDRIGETPRPSIKLMKLIFRSKFIKGAEIGVSEGENAKSILKELNIDKLYLIDIWGGHKIVHYKELITHFKTEKRVEIIKRSSSIAVEQFKDNSLDFVYIDANHSYLEVYHDIEIWSKKVKEGGIVAGHDVLNILSVLEAVSDYCKDNQIIFYLNLPDWYFMKGEGLI